MPRRRSTETMERDARALDLKHRGLSYRQIAGELGLSSASAHDAVRRAIADGYRLSREEDKRVEEERLDGLLRTSGRVMATRHYKVTASGKVALHPETEAPLVDDEPVIQAGLALLRVSESRRSCSAWMPRSRLRCGTLTRSTPSSNSLRQRWIRWRPDQRREFLRRLDPVQPERLRAFLRPGAAAGRWATPGDLAQAIEPGTVQTRRWS